MYKIALFLALHLLLFNRLIAVETISSHSDVKYFSTSASEDENPTETGVSITELLIQDVTFCDPNGTAEITQITRDGVVENISKFEITWFYYNNNVMSTGPKVEFLNVGQYFVSAKHTETGVESDRMTFMIHENIIHPIVNLTILSPNTSCDPSNPTGSIMASVPGALDPYAYDFTWFEGPFNDHSNKISSHTPIIHQLSGGIYTVEVLDYQTGCIANLTIYLPDEILLPHLDIHVENSTNCLDNGEIRMKEIEEGGSQDLNDYTFDLYNDEKILIANGSPLFTQLAAGTYYVSATNIITQCKSNVVKIDIVNEYDPSAPSTDFTIIGPNSDFSRCESGPMILEAQGGENFRWYDSPQEGKLLHEGTMYTVENLQKSKSIWVSGYDPVCNLESDRKEIPLKVITLPLITSLSADVSKATINTDANGVVKWYLNDEELEGQNEKALTAHTDGIYSVEVVNGDCSETKAISFKGLTFSKSENLINAPSIANSYYQWFLNDALITQETSPTLRVFENGTYSVKITYQDESGRRKETQTLNYTIEITDIETITGIGNSFVDRAIKIYPIPFENSITIEFAQDVHEKIALRLWNMNSKIIIDKKSLVLKNNKITFDIPELDKGVYILEGIYSKGSFKSKIIK